MATLASNPLPSRKAELDRLASLGFSKARTLSALGHPGYGEGFAARTLELWANGASSLHMAKDLAFAEGRAESR